MKLYYTITVRNKFLNIEQITELFKNYFNKFLLDEYL